MRNSFDSSKNNIAVDPINWFANRSNEIKHEQATRVPVCACVCVKSHYKISRYNELATGSANIIQHFDTCVQRNNFRLYHVIGWVAVGIRLFYLFFSVCLHETVRRSQGEAHIFILFRLECVKSSCKLSHSDSTAQRRLRIRCNEQRQAFDLCSTPKTKCYQMQTSRSIKFGHCLRIEVRFRNRSEFFEINFINSTIEKYGSNALVWFWFVIAILVCSLNTTKQFAIDSSFTW